jgi:hypothetical protein
MKKWWFLILPMIVFLISCFDLGATLCCISVFEEANPITEYVWDHYNDVGLIAFKLYVTLSSCFFMGYVLRYKNRQWQIAVSLFGLSVCVVLLGWWFFWFLLWNTTVG